MFLKSRCVPMLWLIFIGCFAFAISLLLTPLVRDMVRRWGLVDRPDAVRKLHKTPVPRLGGIAIMISYAAAIAAFWFLGGASVIAWPADVRVSWLAIPAVAMVFATGLI